MTNNNTTTPKKKKKTMVSLPGSLKNLVHNVQAAEPQPAPAPREVDEEPQAAQPSEQPVAAGKPVPATPAASEQPARSEHAANAAPAAAPTDKPVAASAKQEGGVGEEPARTVTRESSADSWGLFLDLARQYKEKDSQLATIYIDRDLKTVLDRLRASRDVRMPTTAILSAIVARFIYDNEQRIKDAIYGDRLI